jgi:geranylgeranyl reductase family protein
VSSPIPTTTADVVVVGAGPAGCAAAVELARSGLEVVVVDKAVFPRDKCCGDGLTTDALRLLEDLGVEPDTVAGWNSVTDIVIRAPGGRETTLPLPRDRGQFAAVVARLELDHALFEVARSAGATMIEGAGLEDLVQLGDRVVCTLTDGRATESRYVIGADGMWSGTRRALGLNPDGYRGEWHAYRQYFARTGPKAQHLVVWFEPDLLPGYAWSFPLPGQRANVGFGIVRGGPNRVSEMGRLWADLLTRPHVREVLGPDAVPEDRPRAWPIPASIGSLATSSGRVLLSGDAIGATDPMTGEGIAQALRSGSIAARSLIDAGPNRAALAGRLHSRRLEAVLGRDHRFAERLQRLLTTPRVADAVLSLVGSSGWTRRNFARWLFEDYPRAALLTPDRWRRGMFTGPGAFLGAPHAPNLDPAPDTSAWLQS